MITLYKYLQGNSAREERISHTCVRQGGEDSKQQHEAEKEKVLSISKFFLFLLEEEVEGFLFRLGLMPLFLGQPWVMGMMIKWCFYG